MTVNKYPFSLDSKTNSETVSLVTQVLKGDKMALNQILKMHQGYIYNICLKMLNDVQDAEDATQEILIKIVSNLARFDAKKAKFTTWVYRIAVNHILNFKKSPMEQKNVRFDSFFDFIESVPDESYFEEDESLMGMSIEEAKLSCTAGMLMCLSREQRLVYLIGEIFNLDHNLASEIFEVAPATYRKQLSRARADLYQWMHKKCGLVNKDNPCRCSKKTKKFIELGIVDPENFKWQSDFSKKISDLVEENIDKGIIERDKIYAEIYRDTPFKTSLRADEVFEAITENEVFKKYIDPLDN